MICHLKAVDLGIPTTTTKTTKEVIAFINDGLKGENEKVKKKVKLYISIRFTPKLYCNLQLSMNRLITNTLEAT